MTKNPLLILALVVSLALGLLANADADPADDTTQGLTIAAEDACANLKNQPTPSLSDFDYVRVEGYNCESKSLDFLISQLTQSSAPPVTLASGVLWKLYRGAVRDAANRPLFKQIVLRLRGDVLNPLRAEAHLAQIRLALIEQAEAHAQDSSVGISSTYTSIPPDILAANIGHWFLSVREAHETFELADPSLKESLTWMYGQLVWRKLFDKPASPTQTDFERVIDLAKLLEYTAFLPPDYSQQVIEDALSLNYLLISPIILPPLPSPSGSTFPDMTFGISGSTCIDGGCTPFSSPGSMTNVSFQSNKSYNEADAQSAVKINFIKSEALHTLNCASSLPRQACTDPVLLSGYSASISSYVRGGHEHHAPLNNGSDYNSTIDYSLSGKTTLQPCNTPSTCSTKLMLFVADLGNKGIQSDLDSQRVWYSSSKCGDVAVNTGIPYTVDVEHCGPIDINVAMARKAHHSGAANEAPWRLQDLRIMVGPPTIGYRLDQENQVWAIASADFPLVQPWDSESWPAGDAVRERSAYGLPVVQLVHQLAHARIGGYSGLGGTLSTNVPPFRDRWLGVYIRLLLARIIADTLQASLLPDDLALLQSSVVELSNQARREIMPQLDALIQDTIRDSAPIDYSQIEHSILSLQRDKASLSPTIDLGNVLLQLFGKQPGMLTPEASSAMTSAQQARNADNVLDAVISLEDVRDALFRNAQAHFKRSLLLTRERAQYDLKAAQ